LDVAYGRGSVIQQQGDEIPRTFGTSTKTAEPIEMPFGMMSGLVTKNSVLRGVEMGQFWGKTCARQA